MGQALVSAKAKEDKEVALHELYGKSSKKNEKKQGNVTVEMETYTDLVAL